MRTWIISIAVLTAFSLAAGTALAKGGKKGNKDHGLRGQIVSVSADGGSFILQTKAHKAAANAGGQETITINASTAITIDGVAGKSGTDLKAGMRAMVKVSGGAATDIKATDHAGKHKKKQ